MPARRSKQNKGPRQRITASIPRSLHGEVLEVVTRHGVKLDTVIEGALKDFFRDRGVVDSLDEIAEGVRRVESLCRRIDRKVKA